VKILNVIEFIEKASAYSPQTVEGKRRQLILSILGAALGMEDIKPGDDIEEAIEKLSKTFPSLKNLWIALKRETPVGVV